MSAPNFDFSNVSFGNVDIPTNTMANPTVTKSFSIEQDSERKQRERDVQVQKAVEQFVFSSDHFIVHGDNTRTPKSLLNLLVRNISMRIHAGQMAVFGPGLSHLPDDLLEQITSYCTDRHWMTPSLLLAFRAHGSGTVHVSRMHEFKDADLLELIHNSTTVLRDVDVSWTCVTGTAIKTLLETCASLTTLNLSGVTGITTDTFSRVASTQLHSLHLSSFTDGITDSILEVITQHCSQLESLSLDSCLQLTVPGLTASLLHIQPCLQRLDLSNCTQLRAPLTWIPALPQLRSLCLREVGSIVDLTAVLANAPNLVELAVAGPIRYHDEAAASLFSAVLLALQQSPTQLQQLQRLHLTELGYDAQVGTLIGCLSQCEQLVSLTVAASTPLQLESEQQQQLDAKVAEVVHNNRSSLEELNLLVSVPLPKVFVRVYEECSQLRSLSCFGMDFDTCAQVCLSAVSLKLLEVQESPLAPEPYLSKLSRQFPAIRIRSSSFIRLGILFAQRPAAFHKPLGQI